MSDFNARCLEAATLFKCEDKTVMRADKNVAFTHSKVLVEGFNTVRFKIRNNFLA